ncbi:MAG: 2-dehydropantoate 2-reductase [Lachnospiraceae bacterium]|nr:2-dehydropantoate 2-reductase [Lachnospiraceae bacterium]
MKIYVDYDDCLCETARAFSLLAARMFGKDVPYEKIRYFNLQDSFELTDSEYEALMLEGHKPEELLSYEETPGAAEVLNEWLDQGHEVSIITGRPFSSFEPSRAWLDAHGFERLKLFCLNKYGRDHFISSSDFNLELEDYYRMHFDVAIEDSPSAFKFFDHLPDLKILVFDRPWNRNTAFPNSNYSRLPSWEEIRERVKQMEG